MVEGFASPEEAALAGFDARYARVRNVYSGWPCIDDANEDVPDYPEFEDRFEVQLLTNEPPREYLYYVHVVREKGRWFEASSHN